MPDRKRQGILIVLFAALVFAAVPAHAQETQPGDPCAAAGHFRATGGIEDPDGDFLVCDGSIWQPVLNYSSAGDRVMLGSSGLIYFRSADGTPLIGVGTGNPVSIFNVDDGVGALVVSNVELTGMGGFNMTAATLELRQSPTQTALGGSLRWDGRTLFSYNSSGFFISHGGSGGAGAAGPEGFGLGSGGREDDIFLTSSGTIGIGTTVPSSGGAQTLRLDVEGAAGALYYCDEGGNNCFTAADVISGAAGVPGNDREIVFNSGGVLSSSNGLVFASTGRLGIGTSAPQGRLDVQAVTNSGIPAAIFRAANSTRAAEWRNKFGGTTGWIDENGWLTVTDPFSIYGQLGSLGDGPVLQFKNNSNVSIGNIKAARANAATDVDLVFRTANGGVESEVFRATYTGRVGIGTTAPTVALDVVGDIHYTGVIVDVSDIRLKENVRPLHSPLQKLTSLNGFAFRMKGDPKHRTEYGVSAQDVREVFPELVHQVDENGTLGVSYNGLIAPMIEAIKELKAENEFLKARLDAIEQQRTATNGE